MTSDYYNTIERPSVAEFRERGSRFIAYAFPLCDKEEFKSKLAELKKEHPKAVHHCFAYRLGTEGDNFRVSDDGEPSGSAGRPILGQIDSKQLTNVLIIVVRYFGGTLLGVPGLIQAYKTAAVLALEGTTIVQKPVLIRYRLQFDYTRINDVMRVIKHEECSVFVQELHLFCSVEVGVPKSKETALVRKFSEQKGIDVKRIQ